MSDPELVEAAMNTLEPDRHFAMRDMEPEDLRASKRLRVKDRKIPINRVNLPETRKTFERVREPFAWSHDPSLIQP